MRYLVMTLIVLSTLICGCKSKAYRDGYNQGISEAKTEIASNTPTFYMSGTHPVPLPKDLKDEQTGLPIKFIAGCIVSDADMGRQDGHNKTILDHIMKDAPSQPIQPAARQPNPAPAADPVPADRIPKAKAVEIARARLAQSPHAALFDSDKFFATYNASKDVFNIDFRNTGKMGEEILPGMWGAGFLVVVDAQSGRIESAAGYKR